MNVPFMAYRKPDNYEDFLKLDLQCFAEGDPPPNDPPPSDPPPSDPPPADPVKTFTQEDLNRVAASEAKKAQEKFLKDLGIDDFKNAKEGMNKFKEWQESQKTEAQKQQEALESYQTQVGEKDTLISDLQAENAAIKAGITDEKNLKAVMTLAKTQITDEVDINAAIKQVIEDYPHFLGEAQPNEPQTPPKWTTGNHNKQPQTEMDNWLSAFKRI